MNRILKPGGAFFATTFLSGAYNSNGQAEGSGSSRGAPSRVGRRRGQQTGFQFFESLDQIEKLFIQAGFHNTTATATDVESTTTTTTTTTDTSGTASVASTDSGDGGAGWSLADGAELLGAAMSALGKEWGGSLQVRLEGRGCVIIKAVKPVQ